MILPESFSILKVMKHSSEVIKFEAELESRDKLAKVILYLEGKIIKLNDYPNSLKVKVSEAKSDFPVRHSWDSFFRDATDMDEMKPGERPDTIHITNLPISWFVHKRETDEDAPPSESIFKKAFEKFGGIRQVDIPAADPFRMQMKSTIRGITTLPSDSKLYFEGYIQYNEYIGFVQCMDALRGRKLLRKNDDLAEWCGIKVDFDKTKHMTDAAVKRRAIVRERLSRNQKSKDEEERLEKERIARREAKDRQKHEHSEKEKLEKMREREEKRKKKQLAKLVERDNVDLHSKIAEEQRKLLKEQKKLQAIRLIEELFKRIELRPELKHNGQRDDHYYQPADSGARSRMVDRMKRRQEEALEAQRNQLKDALDGRIVIRTVLETKKAKRDSSISSISSNEHEKHKEVHKRIKMEKLTTPDREMDYKKAAGIYGMPPPYGFGYPNMFPACAPGYPYPQQTSMYYPVRGAYYAPPDMYGPKRPYRGRGRGAGRGRGPRMPYFDGPDASHQYYKYFKKLTESEYVEHDNRAHSRSRSRRRSYSRSRSRSRSRRRSYSRSRSRSRRSRSRRSRSRRSRSRSRRSRSRYSRSRSKSRRRSRSRSRRSRSKTKLRTPEKTTPTLSPKQTNKDSEIQDVEGNLSPNTVRPRERTKSWSLPKESRKSWSKSP